MRDTLESGGADAAEAGAAPAAGTDRTERNGSPRFAGQIEAAVALCYRLYGNGVSYEVSVITVVILDVVVLCLF